jgi:hypothetical protein
MPIRLPASNLVEQTTNGTFRCHAYPTVGVEPRKDFVVPLSMLKFLLDLKRKQGIIDGIIKGNMERIAFRQNFVTVMFYNAPPRMILLCRFIAACIALGLLSHKVVDPWMSVKINDAPSSGGDLFSQDAVSHLLVQAWAGLVSRVWVPRAGQ